MEDIEDTSGFYRQTESGWEYAPNFVYSKNYSLLKSERETYTYPIDGWSWYDEQPY